MSFSFGHRKYNTLTVNVLKVFDNQLLAVAL